MKKLCKPNFRMDYFEGCGKEKPIFKYGSCQSCFISWSQTTANGKKWLKKQTKYKLKEKEKERRKETRKLKQELNSGNAMKLADMYFSRYIRLKYSFEMNGELYCTCFTSGEIIPIKELDNGHFEKREHKATRYHEDNCRPQSKTDNGDTKHNGKQKEFRENLVMEIGEERVLEVERLAKTSIKADTSFYKKIADKYRILVNEIQKEKGIKVW